MYGLDCLGLSHFGNVAANNWPQGFACGLFSKTFGDALPALALVLATKKCPRVRVQLCYKPTHDYSTSFSEIRDEAIRVTAFAKRFPFVDWEFSGATEHRLGRERAQALCNLVLKIAPFVRYINNPIPPGALLTTSDSRLNEFHGGVPRGSRYNFSFDGASAFDADISKTKETFHAASTFYIWGPRCNGKWSMNDTTPIEERNGFVDANYIKMMISLTHEKGKTELPPKWIYKSVSEMHGPLDQKGEHPVFIAPLKTNTINLVAANGHLLERLPLYGSYDGSGPGFWRYYSDFYGYKLAEEAKKTSGSPVVSVVVDDKQVGCINPSFREGIYR